MRRLVRSLASSLIAAVHSETAPRILYYHRVDEDDHRSCVRPRQFRAQMAYLSTQGYTVVSLEDLYHHLRLGHSLPERSVVLTFDDGFADNYIHAYPILHSFSFPATIFLTVGFIGTTTLPVLSGVQRQFPPLTWEQVREMSKHQIAFGSHTLSHPSLPDLAQQEVVHEVRTSRLQLEDRLGQRVPFFCYPRGALSPTVKKLVRQAGYTGACSVYPGPVHVGSDHFALPRTYIGRDDTLDDFRKKLCGGYDLLHAGLQLWRGVKTRHSST